MTTTTLSFSVRIAQDEQDLLAACAVRATAYGRHMPEWRDKLQHPDDIDRLPSTAVLVCEDKKTNAIVGTARVQSTAERPLLIEECVDIPTHIAAHGRAEISRIAALPGADNLVKIALWKCTYLHCVFTQSRYMVIGARNEALARQYRRLGFTDLADGQMVPLHYAGGLPHSVLAFDVYAAERTWLSARHELYEFVFGTHHPDIQLYSPKLAPARRRWQLSPSEELAGAA